MEQLIRNLYLNIRKDDDAKENISKEFQEEIVNMLKDEIGGNDAKEFERICDVAFMIGAAGEENGFVKGFKYAYRLFAECIQK